MILRSMRMTGEKARGATLTSDEQTECLAELNTFMDSCANERLLCYQVTEDTHALTTSTTSYTVGPGGDIDTTRPVKIVDPCFVRDSSGYDTPVTVINTEQYARIVDKDAGYTVPTYLYYDMGFSATSTGTISIYPAPSASLTLHFHSWKQLGTFANLSTQVLLPPGYQLFIESNFAIHLAAGFAPVSAEVAKLARDSRAAIKGVNVPDVVSRLDTGVVSYRGSILTGP
jgi:hypothetical protein